MLLYDAIDVLLILRELLFFGKIELLESKDDSLAKRIKVFSLETMKVVLAPVAIERCFKSINVIDAKLLHEIPGGGHFITSKAISAALDLKEGISVHQKRKQFLLKLVLLFAGVNEAIELFGMAVKIQHKLERRLFNYKLFQRVDFRIHPLVSPSPLTIDIVSSQVGSEVSVYYTVHIQHRNTQD